MSVPYRISDTTRLLMLGAAVFWDLISIIPWVGSIISFIFGWGTFLLWFHFLGVSFFSAKKGATAGAQNFIAKRLVAWLVGILGEGIAGIFGLSGVYPGFLITVILMIRNVRKEDEQVAAQEQAQLQAQANVERQRQAAADRAGNNLRPRMDDMVPTTA